MTVTWDPNKPEALTFLASGVGTQPPSGAVEGYRQMRGEVIARLVPACGTWDVGPETCWRLTCEPVPATPAAPAPASDAAPAAAPEAAPPAPAPAP
jgi:hypothetical protein